MSEHDPQPPPTPPRATPTPPAESSASPTAAPPGPQAWQQGPSGPRSSFGRRLVAFIVDNVIIGVIAVILILALGEAAGYGLWLLVALAYYTFLEGGPRGQTVGKMALGIRVIDFRAGGPIGYPRGFLRYIGKVIASLPCYLGYFWMLWDRERQCWQDKIATTVVVPVEYYPV
jgi:uncharacterized RDD family membrane protein YckC